jgi:hypothetical protein
MPCIKVHFYNPKKDTEGVWNKIVSYLDPPYCHCEIEFLQGLACAVYINGTVHMKTRNFDPRFYDCVSVPCTTAAYDRALEYCMLRSSEQQHFSLSMSLATKIALFGYSSTGTFCSKLCAEALQQADVLSTDVNARRITPSGLHALLAQPRDSDAVHHSGVIAPLDFAV